MGITCIKDHRLEHSMCDPRWLNGCAQCEIERLRAERDAAVAAERQRCADICEGIGDTNKWSDAHECARAIRNIVTTAHVALGTIRGAALDAATSPPERLPEP